LQKLIACVIIFPEREMNQENIINLRALPDDVDEIINQFRNDRNLTTTLINNKNFFNDFISLLGDLNKIISERTETGEKYNQISLF